MPKWHSHGRENVRPLGVALRLRDDTQPAAVLASVANTAAAQLSSSAVVAAAVPAGSRRAKCEALAVLVDALDCRWVVAPRVRSRCQRASLQPWCPASRAKPGKVRGTVFLGWSAKLSYAGPRYCSPRMVGRIILRGSEVFSPRMVGRIILLGSEVLFSSDGRRKEK